METPGPGRHGFDGSTRCRDVLGPVCPSVGGVSPWRRKALVIGCLLLASGPATLLGGCTPSRSVPVEPTAVDIDADATWTRIRESQADRLEALSLIHI